MNMQQPRFDVRPANWLPLPGVDGGVAARIEQAEVDENDLFPKGTVESYYPLQRYGFIVTRSGVRIKFDLRLTRLVGPRGEPRNIRVGDVVGYDRGKTSHGERVAVLKVY